MDLNDVTRVFRFFLIAGGIRQPESPTACKFIFLNHDYKLKPNKLPLKTTNLCLFFNNSKRGYHHFYFSPLNTLFPNHIFSIKKIFLI